MERLATYCQSHATLFSPSRLERLQTLLRYFENAGAIRIEQQGMRLVAVADTPVPAGVVIEQGSAEVAGVLLRVAGATHERQTADEQNAASRLSGKRA